MPAIEVMKKPYLGTHGHIAIGTNYIERAIYHMELQGFEFDMDTAKQKDGKLVAVYLYIGKQQFNPCFFKKSLKESSTVYLSFFEA